MVKTITEIVAEITPEKIRGAKDSDIVEILNNLTIIVRELEIRLKKGGL